MATHLIDLDNAWSKHRVAPELLIEPLSALVALNDKNIQPWAIKYESTRGEDWKLAICLID